MNGFQCAAFVLTALSALLHVYFLVLEMFLWDTPKGRKVFKTTEAFSRESKALAANQGLYNGFLAGGLVLGLTIPGDVGFALQVYSLACVVIAGVYGGATVNKRIFFIQSLPAVAALFFLAMG